ncbi:hypothetical protein LINPERHAP2_LOCUS16052, partial [Linum perenne]
SSVDEIRSLLCKSLDTVKAASLCDQVTEEEIKNAMFNIPGDKRPGPDGFTLEFFKKSWNLVGGDVVLAVKTFFKNGNLHRCYKFNSVSLC